MDIRLTDTSQRMQKAVEIVSSDFSSIRTGRANSSLIENIMVSAYDGAQKLKVMELGTISAPDAKTLVVQPWDSSVTNDISRALSEANIGLNPIVDGNIIRISFPPLTEERRAEFVKLLKQKVESGKVMIRQLRHDKMAELKRGEEKNEITEDDRKHLENELQKLTDEYTEKIEEMGKRKEEELTQI
jgi:ribosome recycling factor